MTWLRTRRQVVLDYCSGLTDDDWSAPAWATNRIAWRTAGLTIAGDTDYAGRFLDALDVI
jgi:hypothetical protein